MSSEGGNLSKRGVFVTLEGGEGAGKSSLLQGLALALSPYDVLCTREPGGSEGANAIRSLLVEGATDRWSPVSEALLLSAARADHVERTIAPALAKGRWVICDRFTDSTFAYQVAAGGLQRSAYEALTAIVNPPRPDLTLILDVPAELGLARARARGADETRFESRTLRYHKRVRDAFLRIAEAEPDRCVVLDASAPPDAVLADALSAIHARLS